MKQPVPSGPPYPSLPTLAGQVVFDHAQPETAVSAQAPAPTMEIHPYPRGALLGYAHAPPAYAPAQPAYPPVAPVRQAVAVAASFQLEPSVELPTQEPQPVSAHTAIYPQYQALPFPRLESADLHSLNITDRLNSVHKDGVDHWTSDDMVKMAGTLIDPPNVYVSLQHVSVEAEVAISKAEYLTVFTAVVNGVSSIFGGERKKRTVVLRDITTVFEPGRFCLVLGPPGCGKSSLLKFVAARADASLVARTTGKLRFNGVEVDPKMVPRVVTLVPQQDVHTPVLTVKQTLDFAFKCTDLAHAKKMQHEKGVSKQTMQETRRTGNSPKVAIFLKMFGLERCKDTIVGDSEHRGVSGGEKKRVTSAEHLLQTACVSVLDEISTGLDSAATYDICKTLGGLCRATKSTSIVSLLQPPPDVVSLFDDLLLLGPGGNLVYHGPVTACAGYFEQFGFKCPEHVDFADFLVDICSEDAAIHFVPGLQSVAMPPTCIEMAERWKRSQMFHAFIQPRFAKAVANGSDGSKNSVNQAPFTSEFGASFVELLSLNIGRHFQVLRMNAAFVRQRIIQATVQGIMIGTIFWQEENPGVRIPMFFLLVALVSMGQMYIVNVALERREVFYKHRTANFYPTIVYVLAELLADLPQQVLEAVIVGCFSYFFSGFQSHVFYNFLFLLILTSMAFSNTFKAVTAHMASPAASQGAAIGFAALSFCFSGFLVTKEQIPNFFIWIYWLLPFSWVMRALAQNEFRTSGPNGDYEKLVGPPTSEVRLGDALMKAAGIDMAEGWIAGAYIYLIGLITFSLTMYTLGLHYRRLNEKKPVVKEEKEARFETWSSPMAERRARMPSLDTVNAAKKIAAAIDHSAAESVAEARATAAFQLLQNLSVHPPAVTIALSGLEYTVTVGKNEKRKLLTDVNAVFEPGMLIALMGSSGAGKTTLMDVIAGRKTGGEIAGRILINGHNQDLKTFARVSGYVEQTDNHMESMTVREALRFSALHRLPKSMPFHEKEQVMEAVADVVELTPILGKTIVNLSAEQRKRLTLGVEMAANPSVLFLDEPTSGLDSRSARIVIRVVKRIASMGRTIICTIHQPSFEIFSSFDRLLLLKRGGLVVYNGDLGPVTESATTHQSYNSAHNMVGHFEGANPEVPRFTGGRANPAEYMLEVLGAGTGQAVDNGVVWEEEYKRSAMSRETEHKLANVSIGTKVEFKDRHAASLLKQLWYSTERWALLHWRNVGYNFTRILIIVIVSLLFSLSIVSSPMAHVFDQSALQSLNGCIFAGVFFIAAINAITTVGVLGEAQVVYYKEIAAGMYHPFAYLWGLTIVELPWVMFLVLVHTGIFYTIAQLDPSGGEVLRYILNMFLFCTTLLYFGQMISALVPTTKQASLAVGSLIGTLNLYSGFFMPESAIPWPWKLFYYISPARFGLKATMPPQFYCSKSCVAEDANYVACFGLDMPEGLTSLHSQGAWGPGCNVMADITGQVAYKKGADWVETNLGARGRMPAMLTVWDYWRITTESVYEDCWSYTLALVGFAVAFRIITFLAITYLKHIKR